MPNQHSSLPAPLDGDDIQAIFRLLRRGAGREHVTDANVDALISLAKQHGEAQLEYLLREWRSACGENVDATDLQALPKFPPPL